MFKYLHVAREIEKIIQSESHQEGDRLPSIRSLSKQFRCSISSVIKALDELVKQHIVYPVPGSGYYSVKKYDTPFKPDKLVYDFRTSKPDSQLFPYRDFMHCMNKVIDFYKEDLFVYGTNKGLPSLISVIHKQLMDYQVFTKEQNIFVTSGVQQALFLLNLLPFPNNKKVILVEQPSYHLFMDLIHTQGIITQGIKRSRDGIDLKELEEIFRTQDIKFFYTMPRLHNPLGTSFTKTEKQAMVQLAAKYDVYIVEDDYLADFESDSKSDPLFAYDTYSRVIYLKSFSKIIFPGLRIGIAVLPDQLIDSFQKIKALSDIDSSMISQAALEIYIKSGMFDHHKRKIKLSYDQRSQILQEALYEAKLISNKTPSSLQLAIHIPHLKNINSFVQRLQQKDVWVKEIDENYLIDFPKESLISFSITNMDVSDIQKGMEIFIETLTEIK